LIDTIKSVEQNYKWIIYRLCFESYQNENEIINTETADQNILDSDAAGLYVEMSGMNLASDFPLSGVLERNLTFLILRILARNNLVVLMSDVMAAVPESAREESLIHLEQIAILLEPW
jgi:hypothetical protein